mmetsp:Transcript_105081/g.328650  ORF Transcript_105081/g.328650 Transcript_105081/m.328650 type:complete len:95 (+) Transcript_105081:76-360(+)
MEGMDEAQKKVALGAQGAKNLAEMVHSVRAARAAAPRMASCFESKKWENFPKEVKKAYKLKVAGRFEEQPLSIEAIIKKEFPDGNFLKPWAGMA